MSKIKNLQKNTYLIKEKKNYGYDYIIRYFLHPKIFFHRLQCGEGGWGKV